MKAIIYVFSGTGNTLKVAELYKKYLTSYETEICNIKMIKNQNFGKKDHRKFIFDKFPSPNSADLVGFAFPIHGFNPPKVVIDFCKQLPKVWTKVNLSDFEAKSSASQKNSSENSSSAKNYFSNTLQFFVNAANFFPTVSSQRYTVGKEKFTENNSANSYKKSAKKIKKIPKNAFIFKTGGEGLHFNDYASQKLMHSLKRKGFNFLSEKLYVMPYNLVFRHSPQMVKTEWIYAQAQARLHCKMLLEQRQTKVFLNPIKSWFVPIFRIEHIYAKLQGPFMKVDSKKCIDCMKCVKNCPMSNISFKDGKFSFGTNCALCVRCAFYCPKDAINLGMLNGWRVNGDYKIEKTAQNPAIKFPFFSDDDKGVGRHAYRDYFKRLDDELKKNHIELFDDELDDEDLMQRVY